MNIPFQFSLNTTAGNKIYGRLFEYTAGGASYDMNNVLNAINGANAAFGADAATRFGLFGIPKPFVDTPRPFWLMSVSVVAWYSADVGARIDFGLYSISNNSFVPIYPCVATGVNAGGIARTGVRGDNGFRVNWTADLIPVLRATKQTATDGAVTVTGDITVALEG